MWTTKYKISTCFFYFEMICSHIWYCLRRALTLHFVIDNFCFLHCCKVLADFYRTKNESFVLNSPKALQEQVVSLSETTGATGNFRIVVWRCLFPFKIYPVSQSSFQRKNYWKQRGLREAMNHLYCFPIKL